MVGSCASRRFVARSPSFPKRQYSLPKLLIIDEIGYIPIDQHGTHLFFQLISRRYERGSIVLTSD